MSEQDIHNLIKIEQYYLVKLIILVGSTIRSEELPTVHDFV